MMIQLQGLLSTITFLDIIDIVVVAYFLYRLFLMLKMAGFINMNWIQTN